MILVTGAAGKTGQAVLNALSTRGLSTRAFVRSDKQAVALNFLNNNETLIGDLKNPVDLEKALQGCESLYFICPNMSPDELIIGNTLIELSTRLGIKRFVYHSVLHPHVEDMPHHWYKMRVEEQLFKSGLNFSIIQSCAYMQNILGGWKKIIDEGKYSVPYSIDARISIVDLKDVGEAAATIIADPRFIHGIYELAGPQNLSQSEVAEEIGTVLKRKVQAVEQNRMDWQNTALQQGMDTLSISTLIKMFEYYDKHGFSGSSAVLESLLGRKPTSFSEFLKHYTNTGVE